MTPEASKSRRLTANDVKNFIDRTNLNQSGGYFVQGTREWTIRTVGELLNAESFRKVIISKPGDPTVYLSDVADAEDLYDRPDSYARINGKRGIVFSVLSQAGTNILDTIGSIDRELQLLQKDYGPRGAKFQKVYDSSNYIRDAVKVVKESLIEAIVLVLLGAVCFPEELEEHFHRCDLNSRLRGGNFHWDVCRGVFDQCAFPRRTGALHRHDRG